jgi:hypothetical protein
MLHNSALFTSHYSGTNTVVLSCELQKGDTGLGLKMQLVMRNKTEFEQICFFVWRWASTSSRWPYVVHGQEHFENTLLDTSVALIYNKKFSKNGRNQYQINKHMSTVFIHKRPNYSRVFPYKRGCVQSLTALDMVIDWKFQVTPDHLLAYTVCKYNIFSAILHASLALMFIYWWHKSCSQTKFVSSSYH